MNLLAYHSFYLVGIKGVAMTSLAQCLIDAGKKVQGSDLAEEFVTQPLLNKRGIHIDIGFEHEFPKDIECVIYTAAHSAQQNPQVQRAFAKGLPVFSQAEALAQLFNQKSGIAVCGVGGKSTVSAMIAWILEKNGKNPSFSVGVGNIPGLNKTGQWSDTDTYFVAEADEYVTDPSAPSREEEITPRFSFMTPFITVCTNLSFDHPDVYRDFEHTQEVFKTFFSQIKEGGTLVANSENKNIIEAFELKTQIVYFGESADSDLQLMKYKSQEGFTKSIIRYGQETFELKLQIPGKYNVLNACAAILAAHLASTSIKESVQLLADFRSTQRRAEFVGEKSGVRYYDDYAHHPHEVSQVIRAFREWFPERRLVIAFQSHTFSRTKALFNEFVESFAEADEVIMIDIFASAREQADPSITSDLLCTAINQRFPHISVQNFHTLQKLAEYLKQSLNPHDVVLTLGAGDIYKVHELL